MGTVMTSKDPFTISFQDPESSMGTGQMSTLLDSQMPCPLRSPTFAQFPLTVIPSFSSLVA